MSASLTSKNKLKHHFFILILLGLFLLFGLSLFSLAQGATAMSLSEIGHAFFRFDGENKQHLILLDLRLPRIVAGILIGSALSVAGAIMQGITRNPLADSGLMGLNAGAGFGLAICFAWIPQATYLQVIFFCFAGAWMAALFVYRIATFGKKGTSPFRLVLAGAAVSALFVALSQGVALFFNLSQDIMFWVVGGVCATTWNQVAIMAPFILAGLTSAFLLGEKISLLNLGEDTAIGLGIHVKNMQIICLIIVLLLAGISVSIVGAISFVGLIIPHLARFLFGADYRYILPASALLGSVLMVGADLGARTLNPPAETPLGALIALIGVPFFFMLFKKEGRRSR